MGDRNNNNINNHYFNFFLNTLISTRLGIKLQRSPLEVKTDLILIANRTTLQE